MAASTQVISLTILLASPAERSVAGLFFGLESVLDGPEFPKRWPERCMTASCKEMGETWRVMSAALCVTTCKEGRKI